MVTGIFAGVMWALETVILGVAMGMSPMVSTAEAVFLAPFVTTFFHDAISAVFALAYNGIKGNLKKILAIFTTADIKWLILSSAIGGPVGMTGYVLAVNNMGASVGAVASAVYPAIGTVLAFLFLKERVKWYQWIFLIFTLLGVYGISYSPTVDIANFWLGLAGTFMCAFGWGVEAVILAKCLKSPNIKNEYALAIRQTTSAVIYGAVILPALSAWDFGKKLVFGGEGTLFAVIAGAAFCATVSYLFYYKTIAKIGAAKAMALNITYTAWAMIFGALFLKDKSIFEPFTLLCSAVVVACGILAATDIKVLFAKGKNR